jgi:hypothetical protein
MLQISMRLNEERELKQSLVGFSLLKRFSPKTSFSPSLVRGAWNFSLSNRIILVRLNLVSWIQAPPYYSFKICHSDFSTYITFVMYVDIIYILVDNKDCI